VWAAIGDDYQPLPEANPLIAMSAEDNQHHERSTQNPPVVTPWGFDFPSRHQEEQCVTVIVRYLSDVDLKAWRLQFTHTKNDQPRYVPLVGPAQAILKAHFDRDPTQKGWVFKGARDDAPSDLDRPWRESRNAAWLVSEKHCRFHDPRHTTASYLTMNGASLAEVAEALGPRTLSIELAPERAPHDADCERIQGAREVHRSFVVEIPGHRSDTRRHGRNGGVCNCTPMIAHHLREGPPKRLP
jgi:hypothetical protein